MDTYCRSPRCPSQKELTVHAVKPCFTDTRLIQTPRYYRRFSILFPLGESPYIFSKFNLLNVDTPVNPDNGHLFLAPINLTNVNTSLSTFCCNMYSSCLSECKIILHSLQHFNVRNATIHQIGWFVVVNLRLFWHPSSYAENGLD